jgi:hypothetical protein
LFKTIIKLFLNLLLFLKAVAEGNFDPIISLRDWPNPNNEDREHQNACNHSINVVEGCILKDLLINVAECQPLVALKGHSYPQYLLQSLLRNKDA